MTKSVRVAFVVPEFPRLSETFVVERFLGLIERGIDVHIVCRRFDRDALRYFPRLPSDPRLRARIHVEPPIGHRARAASSAPFVALACLVRRPLRTLRYIARGSKTAGFRVVGHLYRDASLILIGPRVVHFEFGVNARHRVASAKLLGARVVVSFQGADINYVGLDDVGFYDDIWEDTDIVHTASEDLWRRAVARGCPADHSHVVIPPVMNIATLSAEATSSTETSGALRLLSVGRLHWKKGFEYGLAALRMIVDHGVDAQLRIVGDGPHVDALRFTVSDLGLGGRVTFVGSLPPEGLRAELTQADVFLHPAVSEGFSLVVLEAQAFGVPVVATDADGLRENLEPDVTGIVVPRRDVAALAAAVERLAYDATLRASMGRAGRERARARFAPEITLARYERLYRDVSGR